MYTHTPTIFNHFLSFVDKQKFSSLVGQHETDRYAKKFSSRELLVTMFIAQIRWAESIRDLQTDLCLNEKKRYHSWLDSFARSTFSYWLNKTDPVIFENLFYYMLQQVQKLNPIHHGCSKERIYSIDSTLISLTLSVFDRAYYRRKKGTIKLHTRLDYTSWLPDLILITDWKVADGTACYQMIDDISSWSIVLFDRWYLDYSLLYLLHTKNVTFVTRTKTTTNYCPVESIPIIDSRVQYDQKVEFVLQDAREKYPEELRVIRYLDVAKNKWYEFITNDLISPATKIADLYRQRRDIECLFRWLKQNLVIKEFLWTSQNAVRSQVWIALIYYLILHYIKRQTNAKESLLTLTRKLKILLFERTNILVLIWLSVDHIKKAIAPPGEWLFSHI